MFAKASDTKIDHARCPFCGTPSSTAAADATCGECGILPVLPACDFDGRDDARDPGRELRARTKVEAIREMVSTLAAGKAIEAGDVESVVATLLRREELATTGIGNGVAIPHVRHACASQLVGTVAWSRSGIDFGSSDGSAVHRLFLLITPPDRAKDHVRALAAIAQNLHSQGSSNPEEQWRHGKDD